MVHAMTTVSIVVTVIKMWNLNLKLLLSLFFPLLLVTLAQMQTQDQLA